ncbi:MAG TPA: DUF11 domain-containing protein [Candidatus Acidoferrales bacterium]|nr:DUF11 domain-containing protein [Candidatus Acidoferrales bacterium]
MNCRKPLIRFARALAVTSAALLASLAGAALLIAVSPTNAAGHGNLAPGGLHGKVTTGTDSNQEAWNQVDSVSAPMAQILQQAADGIKAQWEKQKQPCPRAAANIAWQVVQGDANWAAPSAFLGALKSALSNILSLGEDGVGKFIKDKAEEAAKEAFNEWLKKKLEGMPPEVYVQETEQGGCDVRLVAIWNMAANKYEIIVSGNCHCNPTSTFDYNIPSAQLSTFVVRAEGTVTIGLDYNARMPILHVGYPRVTIMADCQTCSKPRTTTPPPVPVTPPPPGTGGGGGGGTGGGVTAGGGTGGGGTGGGGTGGGATGGGESPGGITPAPPQPPAHKKCDCKDLERIALEKQFEADQAERALSNAQSDLNNADALDSQATVEQNHADQLLAVLKSGNYDPAQQQSISDSAQQQLALANQHFAQAKALRDKVAKEKQDAAAAAKAAADAWAAYWACRNDPDCQPENCTVPAGSGETNPTVPGTPRPRCAAALVPLAPGATSPTGTSAPGTVACHLSLGQSPTTVATATGNVFVGNMGLSCTGITPLPNNLSVTLQFSSTVIDPGENGIYDPVANAFTAGPKMSPGKLIGDSTIQYNFIPSPTDQQYSLEPGQPFQFLSTIPGIQLNTTGTGPGAGPVTLNVTGSPGVTVSPSSFTFPAVAAPTVAPPIADLSITKSAPATVTPGGSFQVTLTVTNNGPSAAPDVQVDDRIGAGSGSLISTIPSVGTPVIGGGPGSSQLYPSSGDGTVFQTYATVVEVDFSLGTLQPGDTRTITIPITQNSSNTLPVEDLATVYGNFTDPNPANNSATASTTVASPNAPGQIPPNADGSVTVNGNTYRSTLGPNGIPRLSEIPSSGPGGSTSSGIQISLDMTITTGDSKYPVGTDWSLHPKLSFSLCVGTDYGPPQNLPSLGPVIPLHQFACASTPGTNPVKAVISVKPYFYLSTNPPIPFDSVCDGTGTTFGGSTTFTLTCPVPAGMSPNGAKNGQTFSLTLTPAITLPNGGTLSNTPVQVDLNLTPIPGGPVTKITSPDTYQPSGFGPGFDPAGGATVTTSPTGPGALWGPSPCADCSGLWTEWQYVENNFSDPNLDIYNATVEAARQKYEACVRLHCPPLTTADTTAVSPLTGLSSLGATPPVAGTDPNPIQNFSYTSMDPSYVWIGTSATIGAVNPASSAETVQVVQVIVISLPVLASAPAPAGPAPQSPENPDIGALSGTGPSWTQSARRTASSLRPATYHPGEAYSALAPGTLVRFAAPRRTSSSSAAQNPAGISYSIVSNGKSSGEALELQVLDPSGKVKQIGMPEGIVLEPVKRGAAQPVSARAAAGAHLLTKQLTAYCLEFSKLPPDPGMQYRVAPQALQDKYKPARAVLRAGRELAAAGKFHPDSDPKEYSDAIRQYALWSKLEDWDQQKFSQQFLEHTKKNAQAMNLKWTQQMEQAVLGLAPGRWRDISQVLDAAQKLPGGAGPAGAPQVPAQQPRP